MPRVTLAPTDFTSWGIADQGKLSDLITDALAQARIIAPCIDDDEFPYHEAARATLREAVLRRLDAGTGAVTTRTEGVGPFQRTETIDNRSRRVILQPVDITDLQRLCAKFLGDPMPRAGAVNLDPHNGVVDPFVDRPDLWFQYNVPGYQAP